MIAAIYARKSTEPTMTKILAALALTLFLSATAMADVVELKTGQRVEGTLKQADQATVQVEVGGQTITFKAEQVKAMYYGNAPMASVAPTPRDEAMRSLQALRSVAQSGVTYRDYAPRMSDTKVVVDRFAASGDADPASKPIRLAMDFYQLAGAAWNARLTNANLNVIIPLGASPLIAECEILKRSTDIPLRPGNSREYQNGVVLMTSVSEIWSCASARLAEKK